MKPLRRVFFVKAAIVLVSMLSAAAIMEAILREFLPVYLEGIPEASEYDRELGVRFKPGIHLLRATDHQEEIRVNQLGTVNWQENFDGYKYLVFAIGDSYTQGAGVPADASYPFHLDLILNLDKTGAYRKQYGIVNLGISAVGGAQELLILRRWASLIGRPSFILYVGCDNDYRDDMLFRNGYRHRHVVSGSPIWGWTARPIQVLSDNFQLAIRTKLLLGTLARERIFNRTGIAEVEEKRSVAELERHELDQLVSDSKVYGARLIVSWSETGVSYDWLKAWAARSDIPFVDWASSAQSVQDAMPALPKENPHSGGHYRTWVNYVIAQGFARQIRSMEPLDR
jgi:hypothetical protein